MTKEQCIKDLREIFSTPSEFSSELEDGQKYIFLDFSDNHFVVSKKWGYHHMVIRTLQEYFKKNGNIDGGGGLIPSMTDILGTEILVVSGEELRDIINYRNNGHQEDSIIECYLAIKENGGEK